MKFRLIAIDNTEAEIICSRPLITQLPSQQNVICISLSQWNFRFTQFMFWQSLITVMICLGQHGSDWACIASAWACLHPSQQGQFISTRQHLIILYLASFTVSCGVIFVLWCIKRHQDNSSVTLSLLSLLNMQYSSLHIQTSVLIFILFFASDTG